MKSRHQIKTSKAAFTMVEILVVLVIIAVLAGLLFPLTRSMRKKASSSVSVTNLRQIGVAIASSTSDNNSKLPGPSLTDHFPRYQDNALSGQLGWLLKNYLASEPQTENPQPRMFYSATFDYPAANTNAKDPNSKIKPTYVALTKQTDPITKTIFWPLGNYNPNAAGNKTEPMTTAQLSERNTRNNPMITEIDGTLRPSSVQHGVDKEPPHGNFRNSLMFDYSVKPIPLGEFD